MKTKKVRWLKVFGWVQVYLFFVSLGFILGMVYQQQLFVLGLGKVLRYTDIEINFNATEFAEELNKTFIPAWKQAFNETLQKSLTGAEK